MSLWNYLVIPFGYIMRFCYGLFNSYGVALFLYAIITKVILLPLSIKQQKSQLSMLKLRPYQEELMRKYGGNKQRYQEELMALYQREGYSPMSSCLPTFIQLPVIMLIYTIVRRPLTYLAGMSLPEIWSKMQPYLEGACKGATTENFTRYELQLFSELSSNGAIGIDAKFLGIFDLAATPSQFLKGDGNFWLILIPILAGVTAWFTGWITQKLSPSMAAGDPQSASSMKMMNIAMPLLSAWISYTYTSALGLYWIASNIVAIGQTLLLNKMLNPEKVLKEIEDKLAAEKAAEKEKRRLAAEKRALGNSKNSKKKRAMNAQYAAQHKDSVIDTEEKQENTENGD